VPLKRGYGAMNIYRFFADAVVLLHFVYVASIVLGLAAILLGVARRWQWVRNFWFRAIHFLMIALVVVESLCGVLCPLTAWEDRLRELAGEPNEAGSFIGRWMDTLLFVNVPPSILSAAYCLFGLAVLLLLIIAPPRWPKKDARGQIGRAV
jgi:hypothetical protein